MRLIHRFIPVVWCLIVISMGVMPIRAVDATVTDCVNFTGAGSISQAVADANGGGGTITFACGGTIDFTGALDITAAVVINANGNIVQFDGQNVTRHFTVNAGASLELNDFILFNGNSNDGGSISNTGTLTINNSRFTSNFATIGGVISNAGTMTINNSQFESNFATVGGAISNNGAMTINNSEFTFNSASLGGAIRTVGVSATINNSQFLLNLGSSGGGAILNDGVLTVVNSLFESNASGSGGAILSFIQTISQDTHYVANTCGGNIIDNGGNTVNSATGCPGSAPVGLTLSAPICDPLTDSLSFDILTGDGTTFAVTGTGAGVPPTMSIGTNTLPAQSQGPNTWNLTITETRGDRQSAPISITCNVNLSADATCIGNDLRVSILTGDPTFDILDNTAPLPFYENVSLGAYLIPGPIITTNLRVVEDGGDVTTLNLTDQDCFISETLSASATCNGANLELIIGNGNAPFTIDVNGTITTGNSIGIYNVMGPNTFTVSVREEAGDGETFTASVTCNATVIPPSIPPAPIVTVLGCALDATDGVEVANTPDNTYCRVLMRNGGVVSYSGAVPRELIDLGVILAVDVYRLEGGASVNTFPDYARVCLAGTGRLFYMDSRNAPRVSIELQSETEGNLTCGWIPAPGTLVLTN